MIGRVLDELNVCRRWLHARPRLAGLVAFVLLACATGYAVHRASSVSLRNCQEIEHLKTALRLTINEASRFTVTSHVRTAAEKAASVSFYHFALHHLAAARCS